MFSWEQIPKSKLWIGLLGGGLRAQVEEDGRGASVDRQGAGDQPGLQASPGFQVEDPEKVIHSPC